MQGRRCLPVMTSGLRPDTLAISSANMPATFPARGVSEESYHIAALYRGKTAAEAVASTASDSDSARKTVASSFFIISHIKKLF